MQKNNPNESRASFKRSGKKTGAEKPRAENGAGADQIPPASKKRAKRCKGLQDFADTEARDAYLLELGMPRELLPTGESKGQLAYTVRSPSGAVVHVMLERKSFFVVKTAGGAYLKRSFSWKSDCAAAWATLREDIGW